MSNFLVKDGDKAEWGIPEGYPHKEGGLQKITLPDDLSTCKKVTDYYLNLTWCKVSDLTPAYSEVWKGQFVVNNRYGSETRYIAGMLASSDENGYVIGEAMIVVAFVSNYSFNGITFPDTGIYFSADKYLYVSEMIWNNETIKTIDPKLLPDGYPYKEQSELVIEWDGNTEGKLNVMNMAFKVSDAILDNETIKNGILYIHNSYGSAQLAIKDNWNDLTITDEIVIQQFAVFVRADNVEYDGLTFPEAGVYFTKNDDLYATKFCSYTIHPISSDFLPLATPTAAGATKQAAAIANVTAAPTAEEFNALLKSLRDAGILATS